MFDFGPGTPRDRAIIKNTLFDLAKSAQFATPINGYTTWATTSRRLKLWVNVDTSMQPAMFLVQHRENRNSSGSGNLIRRYLDMGFWCYAPTGDESIIGDDLLDIMETALESVLLPDDPGRNELTLGGLVHWARIIREDSMLIRDPGDIDGQALLVLPIRILLP